MIQKKFGIRFLLIITMVFAAIFALYSAVRNSTREFDNEQRRNLEPIISAVDNFINQNGRCPTWAEFEAMEDELDVFAPIFNTGTQYVKGLGGTGKNDYVLGTWDGDQNHCYRSWDEQLYLDYTQRIYDYANGKP